MAKLITETNLPVPDDFYEALISAHHGLTAAQSHAMNAALVLLLSNHIGDMDVVNEALAHAREAALEGDGGATGADPTV